MRGVNNINSLKYMSETKFVLYTSIAIVLSIIIIPIMLMKNNNISVNGSVIDDISSNCANNNMNFVERDNINIKLNGSDMVSVYITSDDRVEEMNIEDYICGVVANEMPISFNIEALKAQAIASRTYLASKKIKSCSDGKGADICDSTHCQVYSSKKEIIRKWGANKFEKYWNKVEEAVYATKGMVLTYNGELVLYPQFFSTSSGKTENSEDASWEKIPYLRSVESLGEEIAPKFTSKKEITISDFIETVNSRYPYNEIDAANINESLRILKRSNAGGVLKFKLGNKEINGTDLRFLIGLNSNNFDYSIENGLITFNCKGYGHGVGMSQWGANIMGNNGKSYDEILKHYYTGIEIGNIVFNN